MKRILCFMLSCILLFALPACNRLNNGQPTDTVTSSVEQEENSQISSGKMQDTSDKSQTESDIPAKETASTEQIRQFSLPKQQQSNIPKAIKPAALPADNSMMDIQIAVGDKSFFAKLYNNQATLAFIKLLPLTITMDELNGNEKFYYFSDELPTSSCKPADIKAGDLMLYGSDCLVLFHESFSTSYSYTRLGYIEDVSELSSMLGNGSVQVTFKQE